MNTNLRFKLQNSIPDIAGLTHDMRAPIVSVKMFLKMLTFPDDDIEMKRLHGIAMQAMDKALALIEEVMKPLVACETGFAPCNLSEIVQSSIKEVTALAMERGVNIRYRGPEKLTIEADTALINRAITNLVVNAIQAGHLGGEVRVSLFKNDGEIFIEVADNGKGIDSKILPKIFRRGFTYGKAGGTGIGLDLCRRIAEEHGGSIDVYSQKGVGTAFVMSLPQTFDDTRISDDYDDSDIKYANYDLKEDTLD